MSCDCHLCRDDREAAVSWQARAVEARAKAAELIEEAERLEAQAERTLERVNAYPGVAEPRITITPGRVVVGPVTRCYPEDIRALGRTLPTFGMGSPYQVPRGVWSDA